MPLPELKARENELHEYPLSGEGATGVIRIMSGGAVEEALLEETRALAAHSPNALVGPIEQLSAKLGQFFTDTLATPAYYTTMIS